MTLLKQNRKHHEPYQCAIRETWPIQEYTITDETEMRGIYVPQSTGLRCLGLFQPLFNRITTQVSLFHSFLSYSLTKRNSVNQ